MISIAVLNDTTVLNDMVAIHVELPEVYTIAKLLRGKTYMVSA